MASCGGAHHWARQLIALGLKAKIIAAHLVAPYRLQGKGGKNDANDATAVCEASCRPNMRFVLVKTAVQQGIPERSQSRPKRHVKPHPNMAYKG